MLRTLFKSALVVFAFIALIPTWTMAQSSSVLTEGFPAARLQAETDAAKGIYRFKRWGLIHPSSSLGPTREEFYRSMLSDSYHIEFDRSTGCNVGLEEVEEFKAYNQALRNAINAKFGDGFLEKVRSEANAEWERSYGERVRGRDPESDPALIDTADVPEETARDLAYIAPTFFAQTELTPPAKRKFDYPGKIQTTYDKEKNQSMAFFPLLGIKAVETPHENYKFAPSYERLSMSAYFVYDGKKLITPHWVTLAFLSLTEYPQKLTDHVLSVKVDGKWLTFSKVEIAETEEIRRHQGSILTREAMELPIPYQQFLILANAKAVTIKIGSLEFELEKEQLEAIRDLAVHTVP